MRASTSCLAALVLFSVAAPLYGDVSWWLHDPYDPEPPSPGFTVTPPIPAAGDTIHFAHAYEQPYFYGCIPQEVGIPRLIVSDALRLIEVAMDPGEPLPPGLGCDAGLRSPIVGVIGEAGPLVPGDWEFRSHRPDLTTSVHSFTVVPEPGYAPALGLFAALRRRRHARPRR